MAVGAAVLFRRASFQPRFRAQLCWLLGGAVAGLAAALAGGISVLQLILLGIVAFLWHAFLKEPAPSRYYWEPLYHSGLAFLVVLNLFLAGGGWTVPLLATAFYVAGYLAVKFMIRDYERA